MTELTPPQTLSRRRLFKQLIAASALPCGASIASFAPPIRADEPTSNQNELKEPHVPVERIRNALGKGVSWLIAQQDTKDFGWHSDTYGAMRGGASITALVLNTIAHFPKTEFAKIGDGTTRCQRGLKFLLRGMKARGCIACPDGTLDYPTYSTALTLVATRRLRLTIPAASRKTLVNYLISAQLNEKNGFEKTDIDFGGWDLLGASGAAGITSGSNVSVTFHAVEALTAEEHSDRKRALAQAIAWSYRCQNWPRDGGFFFHPDKKAFGNKAQWTDEAYSSPRSYGTATCDGLSLLVATKHDPAHERVRGAIDWLVEAESVAKVPGFKDAPERLGWDEGLKFYYFMGLSRAVEFLPKEIRRTRQAKLANELLKLQRDDGRWQNESARMREDDPLIATSFALHSLARILDDEAG